MSEHKSGLALWYGSYSNIARLKLLVQPNLFGTNYFGSISHACETQIEKNNCEDFEIVRL